MLGKWRGQSKKQPERDGDISIWHEKLLSRNELPYPLSPGSIMSQNGATSGTEINVRSGYNLQSIPTPSFPSNIIKIL